LCIGELGSWSTRTGSADAKRVSGQ